MALSKRTSFRIGRECETPVGWSYEVLVGPFGGGDRSPGRPCLVTLSWSDHDFWSGGACPPSVVIERLMELVIEHRAGQDLPERFDAATARRWIPDLDALLRARLGQGDDERA